MNAEELKVTVERLTIKGPIDDQARLSFYTLQALAIIAEQLTQIAEALENLVGVLPREP